MTKTGVRLNTTLTGLLITGTLMDVTCGRKCKALASSGMVSTSNVRCNLARTWLTSTCQDYIEIIDYSEITAIDKLSITLFNGNILLQDG